MDGWMDKRHAGKQTNQQKNRQTMVDGCTSRRVGGWANG